MNDKLVTNEERRMKIFQLFNYSVIQLPTATAYFSTFNDLIHFNIRNQWASPRFSDINFYFLSID